MCNEDVLKLCRASGYYASIPLTSWHQFIAHFSTSHHASWIGFFFFLGTRRPCGRERRGLLGPNRSTKRTNQTHTCTIEGETCIQEPPCLDKPRTHQHLTSPTKGLPDELRYKFKISPKAIQLGMEPLFLPTLLKVRLRFMNHCSHIETCYVQMAWPIYHQNA